MDSYEQKYKKAIELMKDCIPDENGLVHVRPQDIFAELAESGDERIRKELIEYFRWNVKQILNDFSNKECVAWLEKVGSIIKEWGDLKVRYIQDDLQDIVELKQKTEQGEQKPADKIEHERMTKLEEKLSSLVVNAVHRYCEMNNLKTPHFVGLFLGDKIAKDWSKEILESAKKELEEIEQKPAWSEDDRETIDYLIDYLESELDSSYTKEDKEEFTKEIELLKSLKDRVQPQPKQEWSEEDKKMIGNIRTIIEKYAFSQSAVDVNGDLCEKEYIDADNWLKSLRPQNRWKPSDEQMQALDDFIYAKYPNIEKYGVAVKSLYHDLKKLK